MNKNEIKYGQLSLLLCILIPASKLLSTPVLCFRESGRDFWLGMAVAFAVDFISIVFALWAMRINESGSSFKEILQRTLSKPIADIILAVFATIFFFKFLNVLLDLFALYTNTFVVKSNWVVFAVVALVVGWFVVSRGFYVVARLGQVLFIPITVCLIVMSVLSIADCNFDVLRPFAQEGFKGIAETSLNAYFSFGDVALVSLLTGEVKKGKRSAWQVLLGVVVAGLITIFVCVIYVALFGELARYGDIAIARISQFNFNTSVTGRLDWLLISGWIVAIFLLLFTYLHCFLRSVDMLFEEKKSNLPVPFNRSFWECVLFAMVAVALPVLTDARALIEEIFIFGWGGYVHIALCVLIALLSPLLVFLNERKIFASLDDTNAKLSVTVMEV